ncbi:cytochrome b5 isoform X1 [Oratosquilla oratoria]|uniref:cytochrome b5 isoform X1 n=1 Tax=Oratosquilla oratoria TaxID=337810 RepID=UPI003F769E52
MVSEEVPEGTKVYTLAEVAEHRNQDSCWVVIHDNVYDVTKFLDEHPGGEEVLLEQAGKDTTESFEDVGHSTDAREMMKDYYLGELTEEDKKHLKDLGPRSWGSDSSSDSQNSWSSWIIPMGIAFIASMVYRFYFLPSTPS